ncbi:MAG: SRPBCC domain-containing protein [Shimia sp.]
MTHDFQTIVVTRDIAATPETVFALWSDPALKEGWFMGGDRPDWASTEYVSDLAEGGEERCVFTHAEMGRFTIPSHVLIAQAPSRCVSAYRMDRGDTPITASLVTIAVARSAKGTALTPTEQIVFTDGGDSLETRVPGTEAVIDKLVAPAEA